MSKKHIFLLLIFAFLSFTQKSYAQDLPLSTQKPPVDSTSATFADATASSVSKPRVAEPRVSSVSKSPVAKQSASSLIKLPADSTSASSLIKPPVAEPSVSSLIKVPADSTSAASTNPTATLSTKDATQTKASPLSIQNQISDKTATLSTQDQISNDKSEFNVAKSTASDTVIEGSKSTNQTATSTSQNQTSENEIPKFPNKSQEPKEKQESFVGKNIFSFELAYLRNALKNNGWGIGLSFEQSLFQFFSVKGRFSHVTMFPKDLDFNITTVGIGAEILFYPFRNGLDKLYFGFGNETDFYMYLSSSPENSKDTIITIYPKIGWKQNFFNLVFLDLFVSYNFFLSEVPTLSSNINLLERGINYGAKFKFNLSEIWTFVKKSFSS